jgi:hypothetical protein
VNFAVKVTVIAGVQLGKPLVPQAWDRLSCAGADGENEVKVVLSVTKLWIELIEANDPVLFRAVHTCDTELSPVDAIDLLQNPLIEQVYAFVPPAISVPKLPDVLVALIWTVIPPFGMRVPAVPPDAVMTLPVTFAKKVLLPAVVWTRARSELLLLAMVIDPLEVDFVPIKSVAAQPEPVQLLLKTDVPLSLTVTLSAWAASGIARIADSPTRSDMRASIRAVRIRSLLQDWREADPAALALNGASPA